MIENKVNNSPMAEIDSKDLSTSLMENDDCMDIATKMNIYSNNNTRKFDKRRLDKDPINYPPEILSMILQYAFHQSRRHFRKYSTVSRQWAHCSLPILYERISPRINFPLHFTLRSLNRLYDTINSPTFLDYKRFTKQLILQLYLKNSSRNTALLIDEFQRTIDKLADLIRMFPNLQELGITLRIDTVTIPLQAAATAFLERLSTLKSPSTSLWIKLAGIAVLDSQCISIANSFGPVITDFHLTKCMSCTATGLRHFLEKSPKLQSLALYVPSLHGQLLGSIAEYNKELMDLWLDLPMEENSVVNPNDMLPNFCDDLDKLLVKLKSLRRLRLRGIPLNEFDAQKMVQIIAENSSELQSLSMLVWPPVSFGDNIDAVSFTNLTKLIISSNSRMSTSFILAIAKGSTKLNFLDAGRTKIDDACIQEFCKNCPNLESIDISRCTLPTMNSILSIAEHLPLIRELDISYTPRILRNEAIQPFILLSLSCRNLSEVSIDYPDQTNVEGNENSIPQIIRVVFKRFGTVSLHEGEHKKIFNMSAIRVAFISYCQTNTNKLNLPTEFSSNLNNYNLDGVNDSINNAMSYFLQDIIETTNLL